MLKTIYSRAFKVLMKKPLKLWGISLLSILLSSVLSFLCGSSTPILGLAVSILLSTAMTMIYLSGYRGEDVQVVQLFSCFKDWKTIKRVLLGMGWMSLWIFLWALIPGAGIVFAVIRSYEYRLTPYILVTEPDISITDAIQVSKERTNGYRGKMFLADLFVILAIFSVVLVLGLLSLIPYVGLVFLFSLIVIYIVYFALAPLFTGLVQAAFYEEITNPTIPAEPVQPEPVAPAPVYAAPAAPAAFCPNCGAPCVPNAKFCGKCGQSLR